MLSPWMVPFYSDNGSGVGPGGFVSPPTFLSSPWHKIEDWFSGKGADTTGMSPELGRAAQAGKSMQNIGLVMAVIGAVGQAAGSYYNAQSQQYGFKSQALSYQYQGAIARMNGQAAERDAQSILESSKSQIGQYTMQAGQAKESAKTAMAGRGLVLGEGSARDVEASMDVVKDINVLNMNENAVRAAEAERTVGQNYKNEALLDNVSAANAMRSANAISPFGSMFTSLLSSGSQIGMQWLTGKNRLLMEEN